MDTVFPTTNNPHGSHFYERFCPTLFVQLLDTSLHQVELSLNMTTDDIKKLLIKEKGDGTIIFHEKRGGQHYHESYSKNTVQVELTDTGEAVTVKFTFGPYKSFKTCRLKEFINDILYEEYGYRDKLLETGSLKLIRSSSDAINAAYALVIIMKLYIIHISILSIILI